MDMILVKLFATALALSEVMTQPQAVKTHFDALQDRAQVVQILRDGCAHMRQAFDIESINVDDLITTALDDPAAALQRATSLRERISQHFSQKAMVEGVLAGYGEAFADH